MRINFNMAQPSSKARTKKINGYAQGRYLEVQLLPEEHESSAPYLKKKKRSNYTCDLWIYKQSRNHEEQMDHLPGHF